MTMNLYAVLFTHYAPKDSEEGISQYIAAPGDSDIYDYIAKYYGATTYGWELIKENISNDDIEVLKRLGILKDEVK